MKDSIATLANPRGEQIWLTECSKTYAEKRSSIRNANPGASGNQGHIGTNQEITPKWSEFQPQADGWTHGKRSVRSSGAMNVQ
jgi:hypothetical protein